MEQDNSQKSELSGSRKKGGLKRSLSKVFLNQVSKKNPSVVSKEDQQPLSPKESKKEAEEREVDKELVQILASQLSVNVPNQLVLQLENYTLEVKVS